MLLVHHSASANGYAEGAVATHIRQFHALHTGPEKGWPDVAYNFFVDHFGQVWEGRAGSLDGPVIGDATGGNQGFSQLVCLIGNHVSESPSPWAIDALSRVLACIAVRDGVDVTPGATTSSVSRGSNRWPAGTTVETTTIAGHRDMSQTACPGDAAYARVRGDLPALVSQRGSELAAAKATPAPTTTTPEPATTASTTAPASAAPPPTTTTAARAASTDREARPLAAPAPTETTIRGSRCHWSLAGSRRSRSPSPSHSVGAGWRRDRTRPPGRPRHHRRESAKRWAGGCHRLLRRPIQGCLDCPPVAARREPAPGRSRREPGRPTASRRSGRSSRCHASAAGLDHGVER